MAGRGSANHNWRADISEVGLVRKRLLKRLWKENNREKVLAEHRRYNVAHQEEMKEKAHSSREKARKELLALLGGKCVRCGFDDWRGLQIDHINGNGQQDRLSYKSTKMYHKAIKESIAQKENKYQVLCANCNQIKRYGVY